MYRSSPFRSTLNTGYITALDMREVCTEAVHCVALWTRVTSQLWTCVRYVPKQSIPYRFEHGLHHSFGHVWGMCRSSPFRTTLNTGYITASDMCAVCWTAQHFEHGLHHSFAHAWSMYRRSPLRIALLKTGYITALDMCEVCTEAAHCVALWTWVTSQLWDMCEVCTEAVHCVAFNWNTGYITALDMCEVCTEAVHSVALWTRVTSQLWTCVKYVPKQSTA